MPSFNAGCRLAPQQRKWTSSQAVAQTNEELRNRPFSLLLRRLRQDPFAFSELLFANNERSDSKLPFLGALNLWLDNED
jgi:hypothetical protein